MSEYAKVCLECNEEYSARRYDQNFCCRKCKDTFNNRIKRQKIEFANDHGFDVPIADKTNLFE